MKEKLKIAHYAEDNPELLRERLQESFGEDGDSFLFPLLNIEKLICAADLLVQKINSLGTDITDGFDHINVEWYRFDNPKYVESHSYEYFFFCCIRRIYSELKLIDEYTKVFPRKIKNFIKKLEPF